MIHLFKRIKKLLYLKNLIAYIVCPVLVLLTGIASLTYFFNKEYTRLLEKNCVSSMQSFAHDSESTIYSSANVINALSYDTKVVGVLNETITVSDSNTQYEVSKTLNQLVQNIDFINSIAIYIENDNNVITNQGVYNSRNFFEKEYVYKNYNLKYWENFMFFDSSAYRILSPTTVKSSDETKYVIPVVFRKIGEHKFNNFLIVNIDLKRIFNNYQKSKITSNSEVSILSNFSGQTFTPSSGKSAIISDNEFYNSLNTLGNSFTYKDPDKGKCFVAYHATTDNLIGYTYYITIPYDDINTQLRPFHYTIWFLLSLCLIITMLTLIFSAKKMSSSFMNIAKTLNPINNDDSLPPYDLLVYLRDSAKIVATERENLLSALSYAQEKYLVNYLDSNNNAIDKSTPDIVSTSLPFKHEQFISIIIQLYPTNLFYDVYSNEEYNNIRIGFSALLKDLFSRYFDTFVVSNENDAKYIILNLDNNEDIEYIDNILSYIQSNLKNDMEYVELFIGKGMIHTGLEGLKQSHTEALQNMKIIPKENVNINSATNSYNSIRYAFTNKNESELFSALISEDIENAKKIIDRAIQKSDNIDIHSKRQLYSQIITVIFRVLRIKNIVYDENNIGDSMLIYGILEKKPSEIYLYIIHLTSKIETYKKKTITQESSNDIIKYINNNFTDPLLCLDTIATHFNTHSSNISKIIKQQLGIGFHEYVTNSRIEYAKKLISDTNYSLTEICQNCGFSNRQTFYRSFKKNVGITPNEYRTNN